MTLAVDRKLLDRIDEEEMIVESAYRLERLRIFRMRLQANVLSVSPLVRDLADAHGIGLDALAELFRPYPELQRCATLTPTAVPRLYPCTSRREERSRGHPWMRASDQRVSYAVSRKGVVIDAQSGRGQLGFMVNRGDLVAAGWLGECWFHTEGDRAHLVARVEVPETLISAAVGRSIGQIVSHSILADRSYRVTRAVRIEDGPAVAFTFHTGKVPHELPWPELLHFRGQGGSSKLP